MAGSLPQALAANGDRVSVILPLYERVKDKWGEQLHFEKWTFVRLAWRSVYCGLFSLERDGVTWYFVDNETYFRRSELYGYYDDGERFGFFLPRGDGTAQVPAAKARRCPLQRLAERACAHLH